jgi:ribosomal protein S18 acetylase RimI-like enzyme
MYHQNALAQITPENCYWMPVWENEVVTFALSNKDEAEVLEFLAERPIHTVAMAGFIRDNGLVSEFHRGTFYGCRDASGKLEGVALIGHSILLETRTSRALMAFAQVAKNCTTTHLIMGEEHRIAEFLNYYSDGGQELRLACTEVLFELTWPIQVLKEVTKLRLGTIDDLDLIVPVHAQMSFEESGVNPLVKDPDGFRKRCARRLEQNRTYVWVEDGKLIFKADIISETPDAAYLEGIWVNPDYSGQGYALRCLSQLSKTLLQRSRSICLLTNVKNSSAQKLYKRAGFKVRGIYDSIFLKPSPAPCLESSLIN